MIDLLIGFCSMTIGIWIYKVMKRDQPMLEKCKFCPFQKEGKCDNPLFSPAFCPLNETVKQPIQD